MSSASRLIWDYVTPLQLLQFPWRLLAIATVALAGLGGPFLLLTGTRVRLATGVLVLAVVWSNSIAYTQRFEAVKFHASGDAREIARDAAFVADLCDEWMPRGALRIANPPDKPVSGPGAEVRHFRRGPGLLSAYVKSEDGG